MTAGFIDRFIGRKKKDLIPFQDGKEIFIRERAKRFCFESDMPAMFVQIKRDFKIFNTIKIAASTGTFFKSKTNFKNEYLKIMTDHCSVSGKYVGHSFCTFQFF